MTIPNRTGPFIALFLALLALPVPAAERQVLTGHRPAVVANLHLQPVGRLAATQPMEIVINLPPHDTAARDQLYRDIYNNPASTNFHRYLAPEEFTEKFGPSEADYQTVIHFAKTNGWTVLGTRASRSLVEVRAPVGDIERALHLRMMVYQHPTEGRTFHAPDAEPAIDRDIPVLFISDLNNYVLPHAMGSGRPAPARPPFSLTSYGNGGSSGGNFIGNDFRHAYAPGSTLNGAGEVVGLFEYNGYNYSDIHEYETNAGNSVIPTINTVFLNDITNNQAPKPNDVEISGDMEMVLAMAPGIAALNVYEGDPNSDSAGNTIFDEMAVPEHGEPLPHQLSCSWGFSADAASSNNFVRFAMQGQSFFLATGDGGAFPTQSGDASSNEHAEPDITQVGGTELTNSGGYWSAEGVWNNPSEGGQFASAGGYYTSMPIPDYQAGISMTANKGSPLHRNAPDVAMVADQILVILTVYSTNGVASPGTEWTSWGTSFAAPLWAGFNALVNQQATAQGKPRDGFINPALYAIASGSDYTKCFHDITVGNNTWSNSPNLFYAEPGYDLCTGLGSPTGTNLINALMGYAGPTFVDFNFAGAVQDGDYNDPFSTLARGTNAVSTSGTVIIKTAGTSSETMTIKKPMTITAVGGGATVGN